MQISKLVMSSTVTLCLLSPHVLADKMRMVVFKVLNETEIIAEQIFDVSELNKDSVLSLMSNHARTIVEKGPTGDSCRTILEPKGIEIYVRPISKEGLRVDYSVSVVETRHTDLRTELGTEGCEAVEVYDIENSMWNHKIKTVKNNPRSFQIRHDYKVVMTTHD